MPTTDTWPGNGTQNMTWSAPPGALLFRKFLPKEIDKPGFLHYNGNNARMGKQYQEFLLPKRAGHRLKARAEDPGKDISGAGV